MNELSIEARTTSIGLLNYAKEYFKAYEILKKNGNFGDFSPVLLYLFCHGIELCFKSFLKSEKYSIRELKVIGHDLKKLYKKCQEKGLNKFNIFTNQDFSNIDLLNNYYEEKEFEYIRTGYKQFPRDLEATLDSFKNFINQIEQKCSESSKVERKQYAIPNPQRCCPLPLGEGRKRMTGR